MTRPLINRNFIRSYWAARIEAAGTAVAAREGVRATTVAMIVSQAGIARNTFYDNYHNKIECLRSALHRAFDHAYTVAEDQGVAGLLAWIERYPDYARLILVEGMAVPELGEVYHRRMDNFVQLVKDRSVAPAGTPSEVYEMLVGGVATVLGRVVREGRSGPHDDLVGDLEDFLAAPFESIAVGDLAVEPLPPPKGVPLDQTTAPIHYEGDTGSV